MFFNEFWKSSAAKLLFVEKSLQKSLNPEIKLQIGFFPNTLFLFVCCYVNQYLFLDFHETAHFQQFLSFSAHNWKFSGVCSNDCVGQSLFCLLFFSATTVCKLTKYYRKPLYLTSTKIASKCSEKRLHVAQVSRFFFEKFRKKQHSTW